VAPRMFTGENAPPESLDRGALIGARLRHRRLELGMTARELARRVDCSPSLISQVERGRAVPSVSTLWALVTALRISMDRLFDPAQDGPADSGDSGDKATAAAESAADGPVLRRYVRPRITLERGVVWERLTAAAEKDMEFLEVCYPVLERGNRSGPGHLGHPQPVPLRRPARPGAAGLGSAGGRDQPREKQRYLPVSQWLCSDLDHIVQYY
jgi:transcriptional regulator with XRE-family HTH domain